MIDKEVLLQAIHDGKTIWFVMKILECSKNTVTKYMKMYGIVTPKGFYKREGRVAGHQKGVPMSKKQREYFSKKFSGEGNPFFGKKHSDKTKKQMSENHADFCGDNNPFKKSLEAPGKLKEHKERCKEIWEGRDIEYRREFGRKISKSLAESKKLEKACFHKRHDAGHIITEKAGKIFCRSSWEKIVAEYLDKTDLVDSFKLEPFCIKYVNLEGLERYTRIDFMVELSNKNRLMIEVKPKALMTVGENPNKTKAYKSYCLEHSIQFAIVGEEILHEDNLSSLIEMGLSGELYVGRSVR